MTLIVCLSQLIKNLNKTNNSLIFFSINDKKDILSEVMFTFTYKITTI